MHMPGGRRRALYVARGLEKQACVGCWVTGAALDWGKNQRLVSTLSRLWQLLRAGHFAGGRKQGEENSSPKCLWPSVIWGGQKDTV